MSNTALEPSASTTRPANTRSARVTGRLRCELLQGRAVRGVHRVELGLELRKGDVAEFVDQPAHELSRKTCAVLLASEGGAVDVALAVALARKEPFLVEPGHYRHDGRVRELPALADVLDDVAHGRR